MFFKHTCQSPGWTQGKQPTAVMACLDLTSLFLMLSALLAVTEASVAQFTYQGASAPGDIIIGGLFPIHEAVTTVNTGENDFSPPQRPNCSKWVFIVGYPVMKVRQKGDWTDLTWSDLIFFFFFWPLSKFVNICWTLIFFSVSRDFWTLQ